MTRLLAGHQGQASWQPWEQAPLLQKPTLYRLKVVSTVGLFYFLTSFMENFVL